MTRTEPPNAQGTPCWASLSTSDLDAAQEFYGPLLGWEFVPGLRGVGPYVRALAEGRPVAGIGVLPYRSGLPVDWITYFAADSADEAAQRIRDHGGTVAVGPLDSELAGRLAVAADPQGAVFGLWQARELRGWRFEREAGEPTWSELVSYQPERAAEFYRGVFGTALLTAGDSGDSPAVVLGVGGQPATGLGPCPSRGEHSHWRIHFAVADADAVAHRALELGGRIDLPAHDTAHGRVALLRDPQGGPFAVVSTRAAESN
jgi:predicted enzyme related to lactoylglutathione lyase